MADTTALRRRNWIAIVASTIVMSFSYFVYGAAFVEDDTGDRIDGNLVAIALVVAPFVFIVLAFVSRNLQGPPQVLRALLLLLAIGLAVGLLDPLLGAACGFAAGGALTLRRLPVERLMWWRGASVVFTFLYTLAMFVVATPAGVLAGGLLPLVMIGFADEYAVWTEHRGPRAAASVDDVRSA